MNFQQPSGDGLAGKEHGRTFSISLLGTLEHTSLVTIERNNKHHDYILSFSGVAIYAAIMRGIIEHSSRLSNFSSTSTGLCLEDDQYTGIVHATSFRLG